jgi:hypothetical protein
VLGPALVWDVRPVAWAADEARVQVEGVLRLWRPGPDLLLRAAPLTGVLVRAAIALGTTPLRLYLARRPGRVLLAVTYGPGTHNDERTFYEDQARAGCDELQHAGPSAREPSAALITTLLCGEDARPHPGNMTTVPARHRTDSARPPLPGGPDRRASSPPTSR